jgi:hypothetical protein
MAELGRARALILAAIATILTANIAILSADRATAARANGLAAFASTTATTQPPPDFVLFGKADTPFAAPTVFAVRGDGTALSPSSHLPARTDRMLGAKPMPASLPSARVAPNGQTIGFLDGPGALAFMNRHGRVVRILPPPPGYGFDAFAWSPEGDRVAVVRAPRTNTGEAPGLFVMSVLGQPVHLVARGEFRSVDWSHDGTHLAAVRVGASADELWTYELRGGKATQLTDGTPQATTFCSHTADVRPRVLQPMWSPDDRLIAFLFNDDHLDTLGRTFDVKVVTADGSDTVTVHQAEADTCERVDASVSQLRPAEYVSLFGWVKSANMAA